MAASCAVHSIEPTRLREKLLHMKNSSLLADVTIKCDMWQIPTHRCVLSASSSYFQSALQDFAMHVDNNQLFIDCSEQTSDVTLLDQIIAFMYSGSILVTFENFQEVIRLGLFYEIDDLINVCTTFITVENCLKVYLLLQTMPSVCKEPIYLPSLNKTVHFTQVAWDLVEANFDSRIVCMPELMCVDTRQMLNMLDKGVAKRCSLHDTVKFAEDWLVSHLDDQGTEVSSIFLNVAKDKVAALEGPDIKFLLAARSRLETLLYSSAVSSHMKGELLKTMTSLVELAKNPEENLGKQPVDFILKDETGESMSVNKVTSNVKMEAMQVISEIDNPHIKAFEEQDNYSDTTEDLDTDILDFCKYKSRVNTRSTTVVGTGERKLRPSNSNTPTWRDKPKACPYCDETFNSFAKLKKHQVQHGGYDGFACNKCGKQFIDRHRLIKHLNTHDKIQPFKCAVCPVSCRDPSALRRHENTHTGKNKLECDFCHKFFSRKSHLVTHCRRHTGEKPFICEICPLSFADKRQLIDHKDIHDNTQYTCEICTKTFVSRKQFIQHKLIHSSTSNKKYRCKICNKGFVRQNTLENHYKVHNDENSDSSDMKPPFNCPHCKKTLQTKNVYIKHMARHKLDETTPKIDKSCICDVCGVTLTDRGHFKDHLRIHTGERPYICQTCGRTFRIRGHLTIHVRQHSGERPFACTSCGKRFRESCKLARHRRVHTGARPCVCDVCQRGFSTNWNLKMHKRSHKELGRKLVKLV